MPAAISICFKISWFGKNISQSPDFYETDIINNRITQETITRQEEILTRLLEAENAVREKEQEEVRESNEWNFTHENKTKQYLDYIKKKQAQEELLKTTPIQLKPYYKKKVNSYFNSLITDKW